MTTQTTYIDGYAPKGVVPEKFLVEWICPASEPVITAVYTAYGERLHASLHPRFKYWLKHALEQQESTALAAS